MNILLGLYDGNEAKVLEAAIKSRHRGTHIVSKIRGPENIIGIIDSIDSLGAIITDFRYGQHDTTGIEVLAAAQKKFPVGKILLCIKGENIPTEALREDVRIADSLSGIEEFLIEKEIIDRL